MITFVCFKIRDCCVMTKNIVNMLFVFKDTILYTYIFKNLVCKDF